MFSSDKRYLDHKKAVSSIQQGKGNDVIKALYRLLLADFSRFAHHQHQITDAGYIDEVLIQTLTVFWKKAISNQFPELKKASLKTYLFAIGENIILNDRKKSIKLTDLSQAEPIEQHLDHESIEMHIHWDDQLTFRGLLTQALQQLSPKCREILTYSLLQQHTIEEIKNEMVYKNIDSTAAAHSRCLSDLKALIRQMLTKEQLDEILQQLRL
jgi:DNA-directed RNA polymerase specialized sigma24 family protein